MQLLTFVTMGRNRETAKAVSLALSSHAQTRLLSECADSDLLVADVLRLKPSAAILVLEPGNSDNDIALIKKLTAASPETAIITASVDCSPTLILGSLRSGALEFLQLPITQNEFDTVLKRIADFRANHEQVAKSNGHVIAVFSGKGGTGVSFFATNLAAAISAPTLLVDLNLQSGDAASFLGIEPKYSLSDFVANRARLDDSLISSLIIQHSPRLSLLAAPPEPHEAEEISPAHVTEILHLLGQRHGCMVLDLQHTFDPITIAAFDMADDILLLMTLDIPGIRSTKRALNVFERLGYSRRKIHVVVNRWTKSTDVELEKVEAHLGAQLIGLVPNDYRKAMGSINLGQPLVQADPSSKLTVEIKRIAEMVGGDNHSTSSPPRKRLLGGVFNRQRAAGSLELVRMPDTA